LLPPGRERPGWRPLDGPPAGPALAGLPPSAQPELITDVRRILLVGGPLDLLAMVSSMLWLVDPRSVDPLDHSGYRGTAPPHGGAHDLGLEALIDSFVEVDLPETTAVLTALAAMVPDERARARVRAELSCRSDHLPAWVEHLAGAEPYRAVEVSHVLGGGATVMVGVRLGPAHEITVSACIDHTRGAVVEDAVVPTPIEEAVATLRHAVDDPLTRKDDIELADARARITDAVERGATTQPHLQTDDWLLCRPLVEWVARLLPGGGDGV
jgi:hypothetical protein